MEDEERIDALDAEVPSEERQGQADTAPKAEEEDAHSDKEALSTKKNVVVVAIAVVVLMLVGYWFVQYQIPHNDAVAVYNKSAEKLEQRNAELDDAIKELQTTLKSKNRPLYQSVADSASKTVGEAQAAKKELPEMPLSTEEILAAAKKVDALGDYSKELGMLSSAQAKLEKSIAQRKQLVNPSEQFVLKRVKDLPRVTGAEAVTEESDPNGKLNKAGGYTACIYFRSDYVSESDLFLTGEYSPILDAGCDGGGAIEVFATEEDAKKRDDYLAAFDGGFLSSGSHEVFGTCIIRTSEYMTASQQQKTQKAVLNSLIRLD